MSLTPKMMRFLGLAALALLPGSLATPLGSIDHDIDRPHIKIVKRDDLPIANYTCEGVHYLPQKGCYPELYRGNTSVPQAWGTYLDNDPTQYLNPDVLVNLPDTCVSSIQSLCVYVNNHIGDASVRDKWIWSISIGPGCLTGVYLPSENHIPEPLYESCYNYIDRPMYISLNAGVFSGFNRVSVNLKTFPAKPSVSDLIATISNGPTPIDTGPPGSSVNGSISSWFMQAYTYIPPNAGSG